MSYALIPSELLTSSRQHLQEKEFIFPSTASETSIRPKRKSSNGRRRARKEFRKDYPIIVHCHLQWDWVWQRPQQFISRLSQRHPVLFVETLKPDGELGTPVARY